ncbi:MAG: hypothetical protein JWR10_4460, partial [Rubritepida sp.]|nr:hypothetical protein [Rubritepida sp.]
MSAPILPAWRATWNPTMASIAYVCPESREALVETAEGLVR